MLRSNKVMFKAFELVVAGFMDLLQKSCFERREETRCCESYKAQGK